MKFFSILKGKQTNPTPTSVADQGPVRLLTKTGPKGEDLEDNIVWGNLGVYEVTENEVKDR